MRDIITSDDILGKDVVDVDGEIIGVVQQLQIDRKTKQIIGMIVDQGFMKPDLFIGFKYVRNLGVDSIFLNRSPIPKIKGLEIYDSTGKKVGHVSHVMEDKGQVAAILLKKSQFSKVFFMKAKYVKNIGFSMILRKPIKDVPLLQINPKDYGLKNL